MSTPSLLDAIRVVKENEKTATQNYAEAAKKIDNPLGKTLFEELSKFEVYH
jgi:rubrerythrin